MLVYIPTENIQDAIFQRYVLCILKKKFELISLNLGTFTRGTDAAGECGGFIARIIPVWLSLIGGK